MNPTTDKNDASQKIVIRDIDGQVEMQAVEVLQKDVWGLPDMEVVPQTQMVAAKASGGVLLGAFDGKTLVGFSYGFVGFEDGRTTHHSHMLAVMPSYRNFNLGYRLKLAQREVVLKQGIKEMTWTFDPLQSMNAHFNFRRLGVISNKYFADFYGAEAASFLHRYGTDRLWVTWRLDSDRVEEIVAETGTVPSFDDAEPLVSINADGVPQIHEANAEKLFIEIPRRIDEIQASEPELAGKWRDITQTAFCNAFSAGYTAIDFGRGEKSGKYLLKRI